MSFSPNLGRWMQEDPIGFAAGDPNLYRYVHNGPTNFTDPSGLISPGHLEHPSTRHQEALVAQKVFEDRVAGYRQIGMSVSRAFWDAYFYELPIVSWPIRAAEALEGTSYDGASLGRQLGWGERLFIGATAALDAAAIGGIGAGAGRALAPARVRPAAAGAAAAPRPPAPAGPVAAPARPAADVARELVARHGSSTRAAAAELSAQRLPQSQVADILTEMFRQSGRDIAGTQLLPDGTLILLSRRVGPNQPIVAINTAGEARFGSATLSMDLANPHASIVATDIQLP